MPTTNVAAPAPSVAPEEVERVVDSGISADAVSDAEALWVSLPTYRKWAALPTHEKALVCHTLARFTALRSPADADRLREALEPSGDTKAAYHGEFYIDVPPDGCDEDGEQLEGTKRVPVPWDTIKEIMAAIRARAALSTPQAAGKTDAGRMREDPTKMGGGIPVHILARGNWHPGDDA